MEKVFILTELHRAEGTSVLGVFNKRPNDEKAHELWRSRSSYDKSERQGWCEISCWEIEVEVIGDHECT